MFAAAFAGAVERAEFHELHHLSHDLWKAFAAGHLDEGEAQELSERIEARKPKRPTGPSFHPATTTKRPRSPNKQASIERRRRLARASPVPPELVHEFTQAEHAALTVICGEVTRCGVCTWCLDKIAAIAGTCRTVVKSALRKARANGLLHRQERRRKGRKSLTNIVRVLRRSWGSWLKFIGVRKTITSTNKDSRIASSGYGERFGESLFAGPNGVRGPKQTK